MLKPAFVCAFSGHRPNGTPGRTDAALEATRDHLARALEILKARAEAAGGELHFLSGVAAGADIVACETAAGLGIPLHFILPYPEEQFLAEIKHETPHWHDRAERLLASARHGSPLYQAGRTVRVGAFSRHSPDCHAEVNSRMLEVADFLLTVSTGAPSASIAGTQHLAEQADTHDLPRANVDPAGGTWEQAFTTSRLDQFARPGSPGLAIFHELAHHVTCDPAPGKSRFDATASCLSDAAGHSSKAFRRGTGIAISSHALAGFIAAGAASVYHFMKSGSDHSAAYAFFASLAALELLLVGYAFFLEWRNHHSNIQHTWLNCRFAREIMRGIREASPFLDPLFPHVGSHQQDWHRFAMTCALEASREVPPVDPFSKNALEAAKLAYRDRRIRDQSKHYREKADQASRCAHFFKLLSHYSGAVALACVLFAFLVKASEYRANTGQGHPGEIHVLPDLAAAFLLLFLPIFVPLLTSLSTSFLAAFDFRRRDVRYQEMLHVLAAAERRFPALQTFHSVQSAVRHTEEILLAEQTEWLAAQKSGFGH